jgi:sporulation protein YqfC
MYNVDNNFDLPRDVIHKESLMQVTGRKEIVFENFKTVKTFTEEEIILLCYKYMIRITGKKLSVLYYDSSAMIVGGDINEISFL